MPIVQLPLSQRGLTGQRDPSRRVTGDLITARHLDWSVPGLVQKEGGSALVNVVSLGSAIVGGTEFWPTDALQRRIVATADGKLWKDDMSGAFAAAAYTGLTTDRATWFARAGQESVARNRFLYIANGVDIPRIVDADTWPPVVLGVGLGIAPVDWTAGNGPAWIINFREQMIGGGNVNRPHHVYGTKATDHTDWSGTVIGFEVYPGIGFKIQAAIQAFERAWLFKHPVGVFWIQDAASSVSGYFAKSAKSEYGVAANPNTVAQVSDGPVAFISNTGQIVLMEETGNVLTGVDFINITGSKGLNMLEQLRTEINLSRLDRYSHLRFYKDKLQLHATFAAAGATKENRTLVLDFSGETLRAEFSEKDTREALWEELDTVSIGRPVIGDDTGSLWKLDQVVRTKAGAAYNFSLGLAPTDLSDIKPEYAAWKYFKALHLEFEPTGNFEVPAVIYLDGAPRGTVPFTLGEGVSTFPYALPFVLVGSSLRRAWRDIGGEGFTFAMTLAETGPNNPRIARAWLEFQMGAMTP